MSLKQSMDLHVGELHANSIIRVLESFCERIEIAGSIRRAKSEVGDIELVAIPKFQENEAGLAKFLNLKSHSRPKNLLNEMLDEMVRRGDFEFGKAGAKYKELIYSRMDFKVDLFIANNDNFGLIKMIRTGPKEYAKQFMFEMNSRTLYRSKDGYLWKIDSSGVKKEKIPVPTEEILYKTVGFSWKKPEKRIKDIF